MMMNMMTMMAAMVALAAIIITPAAVLAQQQQGEVFESEDDGFRLQVPEGWVIEDIENIPTEPNSEDLALLCPENEALPAIGGEYNCLAANLTDVIYISRWPDLQSMPEFQDVPEPPTTNDLLALWIQTLQTGNQTRDIQIVNNTDVDEFTKIADMTWTFYDTAGTAFNPFDDYTYNVKSVIMFVLSPEDRNTGYQITNSISNDNQIQHSPAVQQVFNSFEVLVGQEGTATAAAPTTVEEEEDEVQQQEQGEAPAEGQPVF
jgi:hypothetical protein